MSARDNLFDCTLTPGVLAIIVVVVVVSVLLAYLIATACVRAWIRKSPTYMYCARCNQFLGSSNVSLPPHLLPGPRGASYDFHDVPDVRVNVSEHDNRPPTGTFQRLGMRTSKSNRSSTFPNFMSPIQASPPEKITPTSEMELLTPVPEAHLPKYVNHPGSVPSSVKISKSSTPYDTSATKRIQSPANIQQSKRKDCPPALDASGRSVQIVNSELLSDVEQETACVSGDDSVFYEVEEDGDCRHNREVSKMSQVRVLASPPPVGASKHPGALIAKTPANANKSHRNMESRSCQPEASVPTKIINRIRSSIRDKDQTGRSVQSEGSGKSRRSLMSFKFNLLSEDRKPKNSKDTQYSPLINQNPTTTEDSCGMKSALSEEDQPLLRRTNPVLHEKSQSTLQMNGEDNEGFIQEENVLNNDPLSNQNELNNDSEKISYRNKNTVSEAKKAKKRGSPGNTGNVSISHQLVDINIDDASASMEFGGDPCKVGDCSSDNDDAPASVSTKHVRDPSQVRTCSSDLEIPPASEVEFRGDSCKVGVCSSPDTSRTTKDEKQNGLPKDDHSIRSGTPLRQDLGNRPKIRTSSSARKEKAKYLGKRPGFTESDITSQSEDDRPRSRIASLRRSHLAGMSQSEEDEGTSRKERDILIASERPSHSPQYPVQTSTFVTTKRGPPTPSSLPVTTPKYITVRERNSGPDTSNYPPNSWESKPEFPPNSWDPINQEFSNHKPLNLSASSGQVNLSINSCINNNLSVTAMDNSTPAEGNHTSSPHSTAHQTSFKPEDMSIPGFDSSLQLQVSPSQEGARSVYDELIESSPRLAQDGRYMHPLNNPMRQPVLFPSTSECQSPQIFISNTPNVKRHETQGSNAENLGSNSSPREGSKNLASPYDIRYPKDLLGNLDNSTGSVSSQNQQLRLNHDASKGSQDTSRGVSLDSTSTLVPSPVNFTHRPPSEATSAVTPVISRSSPSPQHSLNQRPSERNHQIRSMPPVSQWSRVQEHALPPSLPPPASKSRIQDLPLSSNARCDTLNPSQNAPAAVVQESQESETLEYFSSAFTEPMQQVRSMPPAHPFSRVPEHALPPSLPPPASKSRIQDLPLSSNARVESLNAAQNAHAVVQGSRETDCSVPTTGTQPLDMSKETFSSAPVGPMQQVRSMPPPHSWSRVKEHAPPPSLPPPAPKTRIAGFGFRQEAGNDVRRGRMGVVHEEMDLPVSDIVRQNDAKALRSDREDSRQTRHGGHEIQMRHGDPDVQTRNRGSDVQTRNRGSDVQTRHRGSDVPGRSKIPQSNRSQSVASQASSQVEQIRTRSTTESSQAPSLAWDSYGSDPSFIPRKKEDLEDFTLSSTSESEADNNVTVEQHMAYRSDGDQRYGRDVNRGGRGQQNRHVEENNEKVRSYFQSGVRTRSQSK